MKQEKTVLYYLGLSSMGVAILLIILFSNGWNETKLTFFDYVLVGVAFWASCIFGLSFVLRPNWIRKKIDKRKGDDGKNTSNKSPVIHLGHHPDCNKFENHVIRMQKMSICSGCTGLAVGSVVSIMIMFVYLFIMPTISSDILIFLFIIGFIFIAVNYIMVFYPRKNSAINMISNIFLVPGFFLIVISILELTGRTGSALIALVISVLFMDTRIQLSKMRHGATCRNCPKSCKAYGI